MLLNTISNNYIKELIVVDNEKNTVHQNTATNIQPSLSVNLEPKQKLLNKETIVQLQEIQDYSILQITSKKEEIDFNGIPSLEWLKGYCGDNRLYNETVDALSNGCFFINKFHEIVERNKNSETISHKEWENIENFIKGFEEGYNSSKKIIDNSPDPKIVKFFDYIAPKTLQRIEVLKQYLSTKAKEPEIEFKLKDIDTKQTTDIATINDKSCEKTNDLLEFLTKDLEWYKWFLEDKKDLATTTYYLKYFQLKHTITQVLTTNEVYQSV